MSIVRTTYMDNGVLADALSHTTSGGFSGVLVGAQIGLFTNNLALTPDTTTSDLVPATYPGYAQQTLVWESIYQGQDGAITVNAQLVQFQPTVPGTPNTITGYYVHAPASGNPLLFAEMFETAVVLNDNLNSVTISPQVSLGPDPGTATVIG